LICVQLGFYLLDLAVGCYLVFVTLWAFWDAPTYVLVVTGIIGGGIRSCCRVVIYEQRDRVVNGQAEIS
jgi:hypothetical protein